MKLETLVGHTVTLKTNRRNGIEPMVEIVKDDGAWITHRGVFGGYKLRRSRRQRISKGLGASTLKDKGEG